VDWHTRSVHFETPQHEALECETFVRSMQNLKRQGNLNGTKRLRCPKPLFIKKKNFMKVDMKGNAFLIYVFPSPNVEPRPHEIPS
jgi:hypothetical protein